jgi:hypothetical protein
MNMLLIRSPSVGGCSSAQCCVTQALQNSGLAQAILTPDGVSSLWL